MGSQNCSTYQERGSCPRVSMTGSVHGTMWSVFWTPRRSGAVGGAGLDVGTDPPERVATAWTGVIIHVRPCSAPRPEPVYAADP